MDSDQPQLKQTAPGPSWIKLFIMLVVLVIIGVGYGLLAWDNGRWPHDYPEKISMKNWLTYRNEKYGFEFQHSKEWSISDDTGLVSGHVLDLSIANISGVSPIKMYIIKGWDVAKEESNVSARYGLDTTTEKSKPISIGGHPGVVLFFNPGGKQSYLYQWAFFTYNDHIYVISLTDPSQDPQYQAAFDNILSTFKFTAISSISDIDTSTWKTYRNEELGYEIQYPKNATIKVQNTDVIICLLCWQNIFLRISYYNADPSLGLFGAFEKIQSANNTSLSSWNRVNTTMGTLNEMPAVKSRFSDITFWYAVLQGNKLVEISYGSDFETSLKANPIFEQMLSTFKFTN